VDGKVESTQKLKRTLPLVKPLDQAFVIGTRVPRRPSLAGATPQRAILVCEEEQQRSYFPIGLNVSKVVRIGILRVKFQVQGQYMPVHPDVFGQKWNLQFAITPVIPKLIKGNLFGD
jgi:hypothetical protein